MTYREIVPGEILKQYVQYYYVFESDTKVEMEDIVFPAGQVEIIFNLSDATWKTASNNVFQDTPKIELWGQITRPLPVKAVGRHNKMLGIKLFPHTAAVFFREDIGALNDQVNDTSAVLGRSIEQLHDMLLDETDINKQITLIENYLLGRLQLAEKRSLKIELIGSIIHQMKQPDADNKIEHIARQYNMSSRYLHKIFLQYTGVTPKFYAKLHRFHSSLALVQQHKLPLTAIAYECGYFDQSHFIREFKAFTGMAPATYASGYFPFNETLSAS